jgi:hypothetical protein
LASIPRREDVETGDFQYLSEPCKHSDFVVDDKDIGHAILIGQNP